MSEYLELSFEIDGEPETQQAQVRPNITVANLIKEIAREFDIAEPDNYELYVVGLPDPLDRTLSLEKHHIRSNETLLFTRPALIQRLAITTKYKATLQLQSGNKMLFLLQWQPAVIGRADSDPLHMGLLAVNLEWLPNSRRISRRHAQIVEENGQFYVESLAPKNPTLLNGQMLEMDKRYPLRDHDRIILSNSQVVLLFNLQP